MLVLTGVAAAQGWPSAAYVSPEAGLPPVLRGHLWMGYGGEFLHDDLWQDTRHKFNINIGLTDHVGLAMSGSSRDLSGLGAFQKGPEDSRLGLSYWPINSKDRPLRIGFNSNFVLPTGYRDQELYYDSLSATGGVLPSFSMKQTGGELFLGGLWNPATVAEVNAFGGYFASSDRLEQSFRWGSRLWLAPFGPRIAAELGFAQSFTRIGTMPNTQVMSSGLAITGPWGFQIAPGFSADLADEPVYGFNIGLRFEGRLSRQLFPERSGAPRIAHHEGTILIAPPMASVPLADRDELWKALLHELEPAFDNVEPLSSLDLPGLPYDGSTNTAFWNTVEAIALANPDVRWLMITDVDHEAVAAGGGVRVPLLFSQPKWRAECRARVRLIHLGALEMAADRVMTARAEQRTAAKLSFVSSDEQRGLSLAESRALTLDAYQRFGKQLAGTLDIQDQTDTEDEEIRALGDRR
ncbi:hypothetical protein HZB60_11060 [candidate division KSB1 bacterium]|nr:hypothetical protein [candidate division KSB1 bacterium]